MKIYLASSWRNERQPEVLQLLRAAGHEVYDFRNPSPGNGFSWREIHVWNSIRLDGEEWQTWTPDQYRQALGHPAAKRGFDNDMSALAACDVCVLLLPSGRSASFEFGWAIGAGKLGAVIMLDKCEPELMYRGCEILVTLDEVQRWAGRGVYLRSPVTDAFLPLKHRCNICGGLVQFDGTPPAACALGPATRKTSSRSGPEFTAAGDGVVSRSPNGNFNGRLTLGNWITIAGFVEEMTGYQYTLLHSLLEDYEAIAEELAAVQVQQNAARLSLQPIVDAHGDLDPAVIETAVLEATTTLKGIAVGVRESRTAPEMRGGK